MPGWRRKQSEQCRCSTAQSCRSWLTDMKARDIFSYAFSAIKLRKLRAGLTTLGVVIGIAAIVALLSLGQGFQDAITAQFQKGFATNTLIVSSRSLQGESSYQIIVND